MLNEDPRLCARVCHAELLLLAEGGRTAFNGPASEAVRHAAETLGRPKPNDRSEAEWLIDVVSAEADCSVLVAAHAALPVPDAESGRVRVLD